MEISIAKTGESSRANDQKPIREFTQLELVDIIKEQVTKYSEEAIKLQEEAHRGSTSCIYRVLPRLKKINGNSLYEPDMVSIGPYYYNPRNEKFKMAEDYKRMCFGSLLVKYTNQDMQINTYKHCLQRISELEVDIRRCYSEEFEVNGIAFLEMMVVDACFILEIIGMFHGSGQFDFSESLAASLAWMVPYFYRDFLLLENQIPFFVLEEISAITGKLRVGSDSRTNLIYAALEFFNYGMKSFDVDIFSFRYRHSQFPRVEHLLHLVWYCLTPLYNNKVQVINSRKSPIKSTPFIHNVSKLRLAGIKISPVKASSFLKVKFKRGVIEMPNIAIDDLMKCLLLNCVAFEQCHQRSENYYFSLYATFLDCLVNTTEDVEYLRERNVIHNYLTDDSEAADFINRAGKDLVLNADKEFYLGKLFVDVDKHYRNSWEWKRASFEQEYLDKPWLLLSAAGGILLVLATSFQALMAFLTYKYKNC